MKNGNIATQAQVKAENAVKHFEHKLGPFVVAVDSTRMPIIFTNAHSLENEIVYANESFLRLTGYELPEVIGLPFDRTLAGGSNRTQLTPEMIAIASDSSLDVRCRRKDGSEFDAALLATPVNDEAGQLQQYFLSYIDLTARIERFAAQVQAREIYEHTPGFIAFTEGVEHRFVFVNPAYEQLVGRDDLVGKTVAEALPEVADQGFIDLLDQVYRTGHHFNGKKAPIWLHRRGRPTPELRYVDFVYQVVRNANGETVGLFCEGSDVTDVQVATEKLGNVEAQLTHVSRLSAMGTMAATLAHELNQPLAAIANYAAGCSNRLQASGFKVDKLEEGLEAISAASLRAGHIISKLRGITQRTTSMTDTFSLSDALKEAVELVQAAGCADIIISTQCATDARVMGDKVQIQQVIANLLRNACEAAAENAKEGFVVGTTKLQKKGVRLSIRDNGRGLAARAQADLFQWTESTKPDGMGMGLSISRTIIDAHGGEIMLDKTSSRGTTFSILLPLARGT